MPEGHDDGDANWLVVRGAVTVAGTGLAWTFDDPALTTWEAEDLIRWLRERAVGSDAVRVSLGSDIGMNLPDLVERPEDAVPPDNEPGWLTFTEPALAFGVADQDDATLVLDVILSAESAPPPVDPKRPRSFRLRLRAGRDEIVSASADLTEELRQLSARTH